MKRGVHGTRTSRPSSTKRQSGDAVVAPHWIAPYRGGGPPPLADGYIKRILTVGKAALTRAWKEGEIDTVPYVIPGQDGPARDWVLTVDQSIALWNAAELPHERMYLALAYGLMPELGERLLKPLGRLVTSNDWPGKNCM